jgi:hypothetical protein
VLVIEAQPLATCSGGSTKMIEHSRKRQRGVRGADLGDHSGLPYCVEVWDGAKVERILARAINVSLARAIFTAAIGENPRRRITLRRGTQVIEDSAE